MTLLLPRPSSALHIILSQVPDRNLHIAVRVGIPVTRRADLLEMICRIGNTQKPVMSHQINNLGLANFAELASWQSSDSRPRGHPGMGFGKTDAQSSYTESRGLCPAD